MDAHRTGPLHGAAIVAAWVVVSAACADRPEDLPTGIDGLGAIDASAPDDDGPSTPTDDRTGDDTDAGDTDTDAPDSADPDTAAPTDPHAPRAQIILPSGTLQVGDLLTFDGSTSFDPDGDTLTFAWTLDTRPAGSVAAFSNSTFPTAQLYVDRAGDYRVSLSVSDGTSTDVASTTVTVVSDNQPPRADAGIDQRLTVGSIVQLYGAGSSDPDGDDLAYRWRFVSVPTGAAPTLQGAVAGQYATTAANPRFLASVVGLHVLELTVQDTEGLASQPDVVQIVVDAPGGGP